MTANRRNRPQDARDQGVADRVLVLAPRSTETDRQLAVAAYRRGLRVERAHTWRPPDGSRAGAAHLYAGPLFADAVARELGLGLLEAPDDWLARLPRELTGRTVEVATLAEAWRLRRPAFVKPPTDKSFPARVYRDGTQLPGPDAADADTRVLVADVVRFRVEFRLFVLDGRVAAASCYAVDGDLAVAPAADCPQWPAAEAFAREVLAVSARDLPGAVVVDVGLLDGAGWAVVEANAAWASGGYACDDDAVLDVVLRAGGPLADLSEHDRRFIRSAPTVVH
ncbi:MAG: ATP-grasp domain-containing protein [Streptomycetaceae bacterium]|nr:ATP-grasp domain-containing protein [Streptomycetaceae bacterium]